MSVTKEIFGTAKTGETVYLYSIVNKNGMKAQVMNFGAILRNLWVPFEEGQLIDVALGFETLDEYYGNDCFFGATVGPNANRVGGASYTIDGVKYQMAVNDGENNLHSDMEVGYHKQIFKVEEGTQSVTFSLEDKDGSMGFPGNKKFKVTYTLTDDNALKLDYEVSSDKKTLINPTNHSYFNLAGHKAGTICGHTLKLNASNYTPVVAGAIPTGEIASVKGTPMDFLSAKEIGKEIGNDFEQLKLTGGYDHNWVIDGFDGKLRSIAVVEEPKTEHKMEVLTTLPGVQFYAGNFINARPGKDNAHYDNRDGLALETQFFPDNANKPQFPQAIFGPDKKYESETIYRFFK